MAGTPPLDGTWSKDATEIKQFTQFFDAAWTICKAVGSAAGRQAEPATFSQVLRADAAHERRHNAVHDAVARIEDRIRTESVG
jgi:hypothetical protein